MVGGIRWLKYAFPLYITYWTLIYLEEQNELSATYLLRQQWNETWSCIIHYTIRQFDKLEVLHDLFKTRHSYT